MIRGSTGDAFDRLTARLTRKASALAASTASARHLVLKDDPARWRRADLLWPLFTRG